MDKEINDLLDDIFSEVQQYEEQQQQGNHIDLIKCIKFQYCDTVNIQCFKLALSVYCTQSYHFLTSVFFIR